jgi:hypothetical protein
MNEQVIYLKTKITIMTEDGLSRDELQEFITDLDYEVHYDDESKVLCLMTEIVGAE